jgi:hypothetical protein
MKKPQSQIVVVRTADGYFGTGKDLETAMQRIREAGASGTQAAVINIYVGSEKDLKEVSISGYGDVSYPQSCQGFRVGRVKLPMKQPSDTNK